jgi:SAM-dependent methyltransferase
MDYDNTFRIRAASYTYAVKRYPETLEAEFRIAIEMCAPFQPGDCLVNIPAACIEIEPFFPGGAIDYKPFETNAEFARLNGVPTAAFDQIPLEAETASHVLCLASLHHATQDERRRFYREAWRVLRPGGRLIIGDVDADTPQAVWLNTHVDRYNSLGHRGIFWSQEDADSIAQEGFQVETRLRTYSWPSASVAEELDFTRHLFGLDLATDGDILEALDTAFPGRPQATIPWSLRYFQCTKPKGHQT